MSGTQGRDVWVPKPIHRLTLGKAMASPCSGMSGSCQFWGFAPALTSQMSGDVKVLGVEAFQRQGLAGKCRQSLADTAFLGQKSKQLPAVLLGA